MTAIMPDGKEAGRYRVRGDMSFETVSGLWEQSQRLFANAGRNGLQIDLGDVQVLDSSGIALLIAWKQYAQNHAQPFTLTHVPLKLVKLVKVNNLAKLFDLNSV